MVYELDLKMLKETIKVNMQYITIAVIFIY